MRPYHKENRILFSDPKTKAVLVASFLMPVFLLLLMAWKFKIFPFGTDCFMTESMQNEFLPVITVYRRKLVSGISEKRMEAPERRNLPMPAQPLNVLRQGEPAMIFQVTTEEQLTPELAALKPEYLYAPATLMSEHFDRIMPFITQGTIPVAVLPRVIPDDEAEQIFRTLQKLYDYGVKEALVGNIGHVALARKAWMNVRADFGINAFNS